MIKLYHSSTVEVKKPLVEIGRKKVDFGQGFYMTRMRSQAERWAKAVAGRSPNATPVLNVYQFDMDKAKMIAGRRYRNFDRYDREWLEYVIDSRRGGKLQQKYDLVEGGVANDNVIDTVEDYENGVITAEQALGQLDQVGTYRHLPAPLLLYCLQLPQHPPRIGPLPPLRHRAEARNLGGISTKKPQTGRSGALL